MPSAVRDKASEQGPAEAARTGRSTDFARALGAATFIFRVSGLPRSDLARFKGTSSFSVLGFTLSVVSSWRFGTERR